MNSAPAQTVSEVRAAMKYPEVIYYNDELNDEFSAGGITPRKIDESYRYEGTVFRPLVRFLFYHIIAKPAAFLFLKLKFGHRIIGREKFRTVKGSYFMYGNHTNPIPDALIPTMLRPLKGAYVIVHADNVSIPYLGRVTPAMGAVPLPEGREAYKNFTACITGLVERGQVIAIYPEAHIWPYYTHIRNFRADSFHYPVTYDKPVFCFTNTYRRRRHSKTPRIVTYVDGPFYPDSSLRKPRRVKDLRDRVYEAMVRRSKSSDVELIKYIPAPKKDSDETI